MATALICISVFATANTHPNEHGLLADGKAKKTKTTRIRSDAMCIQYNTVIHPKQNNYVNGHGQLDIIYT